MVCPHDIYCILFLFRDFLGRFESSTCIGRPRSKVAVAPGAQLERRSHTEASECPVEVITVIKVFSRSLHETFGSGVVCKFLTSIVGMSSPVFTACLCLETRFQAL